MATVHNPTEYSLTCYRLGLLLKPGATVEVSDEDAAAVEDSPVLLVSRDARRARAVEPDELAVDGAPKRQTARRGSRRVEVTRAPDTETR